LIYRASCAVCGEVVIRADESVLHLAGPQKSWRCTFRCPVCRRDTMWSVPAGASHLLVAGGAQVTVKAVPVAECKECEPPPPAADRTPQTDRTLQLDDVIDFHTLLSGDDWFDQLVQSGHSPNGPSSR
jgi:hypothetical protein